MSRVITYLTFFLFIVLSEGIIEAQTYTISGYITDNETRETLIGAMIQIKDQNKATISDNYGFFNLTGVKKGEYILIINQLGYEPKELKITIENKGVILKEVDLIPAPIKLDEVSIVAVKSDKVADKTIETSHIELSPQMIRSIPTAGNDVFAAAKYLPGIDRTEPFSPLYTVRGGDPGENAVMLDGVMIYNPYHSSIGSGIFNTMIIKNVDLLVGGFGAEYGGRNSSVMYITSKDGNTNELHGEIEPSTFHSKLFLEFPAGKNASMMVAARYFYDLPFSFLFQSENYFYDYNISYTNRLGDRHRLTLKYFESKDLTDYNFNTLYKYIGNSFNTTIYDDFFLEQRNNWKNRSATAIHKFVLTPRIYLRSQLYYSQHRSNNFSGLDFTLKFPDEENEGDTTKFQWTANSRLNSEISDACAKSAITIKITNSNELHAGIEYNQYQFHNSIKMNDVNSGSFSRNPSLLAAFIEDKITTNLLTIRPGLRITNYQKSGWQYEPRINATVNLSEGLKIKAAYGEYLQYIISMNTNEIEMSQIVDYYYPLWKLKPSKSIHYILGMEKKLTGSLIVSFDGYYKKMPVVYAFDMNNYFGLTNNLQNGNGDAYGIELLLEGKYKKLSGWISYSFAKSSRQYPNSQINDGQRFSFDYNRPHTIKSVVNMQITPDFSLSSSFTYLSGTKRSIETTTQNYYYYDPITNETMSFPMWTTNDKNSTKMPPLINLDFAIKKKLLNGFGKQLANLIHADESYVTVTIRNILFIYVEMYFPGTGLPGYEDKYIPVGSNYLPSVGASYTLKF
jgi:hypothetical protein